MKMSKGVVLGGLILSIGVSASELSLEERISGLESRAAAAPVVTAGAEGFAVKSADSLFSFKIMGDLQADGRFYLDDDAGAFTDGFLLRRVRPALEATGFGFALLRIQTNLVASNPGLDDAYLDLRANPGLKFRFGRFRSFFGLETLQSSARLTFVERGLPSGLTPVYENGVGLLGDAGKGALSYQLAYVNGAVDGAVNDSDGSDRKDTAARIFLMPFKTSGQNALTGLGIGLAGTWGGEEGTAASPRLPTYKTEGQNIFFSYKADALASGTRRRVSPQTAWYAGPFSFMGEYVSSLQTVRSTATAATADVTHRAWQVALSWVPTGDRTSPTGVKVAHPFNRKAKTWGALEVAGRYSQFTSDDLAFENGFADRTKSARAARAWTGGVTWYLNANLKAQANYTQTAFDGGAGAGADISDRAMERALFTRIQAAF